MRRLPDWVWRGAVAGAAGGLVFGAAMLELGDMLETIAGLARSDGTAVGLAVHAVASVVIGVLFAAVTTGRRSGPGELVFWGTAYGAGWWLLGGLTLLPLLRGDPVRWSLSAVQSGFPSLLGHLAYGAVAGAVLAALGAAAPVGRATRGALARATGSGIVAAVALFALLGSAGMPGAAAMDGPAVVRWPLALLVGAAAGAAYAVLYPRPRGAMGPALVRGLDFGFLAWLALPMTVVPLASGDPLPWSLEAARERAGTLPAMVLAGVLLVLLYRFTTAAAGVTPTDDPGELADEGVGTKALRGLGRGTLAGLVGGVLFTVVLVWVDGLPQIAGLVGGTSAGVGLAVHLLVAVVLGASYGLLFRQAAVDAAAALGWGVSYGVLWWLLGNHTLLPLLLGDDPTWTAPELAAGYPSLIGHLAYGAALGPTLLWLERRSTPWWTAATPARRRRAALARTRSAATAPGLWIVSTVLVLTVLTLATGA